MLSCRVHQNNVNHFFFSLVHDTSSQEQSFFCGHDNDVMCMAVHPSRQWFASGQSCTVRNSASAKQARICLWNIDKESHPDHDHITVIEDFHQRSVNHVEFDSTGRYLITVGGDDDNSLALYDCVDPKKPVLMSTAGASKAKVVSARFNPNDHTQLVTFGVKHIKFWNLEKNESAARTHQKTQSWALKSKTGVYGKFDTQTILAAEWSPSSGIMYAGGFNGDISSWDKNNQTASIKAHDGPVHCLVWTSAGLLSGGKDGKVILWKEENQKLSQVSVVFDLASATQGRPIRSLPGEFVRSLDFEAQSQCIAVGTNENRIWTATLNGGDAQFVNGGHAGELWGLATHPSLPRAASVSVDGKIALWDTSSHQPIAQSVIGSSTSVDLETGTGHKLPMHAYLRILTPYFCRTRREDGRGYRSYRRFLSELLSI
jgi:WD40 repeat protein